MRKPCRTLAPLVTGRNIYAVRSYLSINNRPLVRTSYMSPQLAPDHEGRYPWDKKESESQHFVRTSLIHLNGGYNFVL